ncbi:Single hybrid motif superfamily protein [Abeliophyllum distichum]|uniref:Single hybrid motif superfamily protein n=1 Tax=Abeliophyllum distichum TaxID=126358 RepID=A0ABD1RYH6_9LAMI
MAACGIGASGLKIKSLDLGYVRPKLSTLHPLLGFRTQNSVRFDGLVLSQRSKKALTRWRSVTSDADSTTTANTEDCSEETESSDAVSKFIPNYSEVEYLLTELCNTTSIAKLDLKHGGFRLHVTRDLSEPSAPPQPPVSAQVTAHTVVETPDSNGSVSSQSLALSKPVPSFGEVQTFRDKAADEGLLILQSPRVGYFRRSRTIKGKRAPPSCKEKDIVKEGQVLCYIEQLGGEIPIESDISGEVVKILRPDGDPVGYGDALIAVLPSFPGIKKLQ